MVIRGDTVEVPSLYPGRLGTASHADDSGRWVVWRETNGHWAAGSYDPDLLVLVGPPDSRQLRLPI